MAVADKDQIFTDEAIRVNTTVNSSVADTGEFNAQTIVVYNDLDKNVDIQLQGSLDETSWIDIGNAFTINTLEKDYATVTDYFPCYRVTAKCATALVAADKKKSQRYFALLCQEAIQISNQTLMQS
jgi:hypothetical protein